MLYKMGLSLAQSFYVNKGEPYDEVDIEIYAYGFEMFFENVLQITTFLTIGMIVGRFVETVAFLTAFLSLRKNAGGCHAKTSFRCFMCGLMVYALFLLSITFIPFWLARFLPVFCTIISVYPIIKIAPFRDTPLSEVVYGAFRKKSLIILITQVVIIVGLSSYAWEFQSANIIQFISMGLALGQLTAAGSLVVAKIRNTKGGELNVEENDC